MITEQRLEALLQTFSRLTIGLVGDLFLDRYLEIEPGVREMSIETDLEAYQVSRVRNSPGALGTVLNNLAALGVGLLVPASVIGDDGHGYDLLKEVRKLPVDPQHILRTNDRLTPTYTKPMKQDEGGVWRELNRLDVRTRGPLSADASAELGRRVRQVFNSSDGLIVLDQINEVNWGVVDDRLRPTLNELAAEQPQKLIFVDSRRRLGDFSSGILKGNHSELLLAGGAASGTSAPSQGDEPVARAASQLAEKTGRAVFCTLGEKGILVARPRQKHVVVPGYHVTGPVDIVGAGDSATSGIVAALLAGATETEAAAVGNLVASITVQQLGTTGVASPQQVLARWREMHPKDHP